MTDNLALRLLLDFRRQAFVINMEMGKDYPLYVGDLVSEIAKRTLYVAATCACVYERRYLVVNEDAICLWESSVILASNQVDSRFNLQAHRIV